MLTDPHGTSPLTKSIIGCAIRVHRAIGPRRVREDLFGMHDARVQEAGLVVRAERPVPLVYSGVRLKPRFVIDFVVENKVIVELTVGRRDSESPRMPGADAIEARRAASRAADQLQRPLAVDGVTRLVNPTLKSRETKDI